MNKSKKSTSGYNRVLIVQLDATTYNWANNRTAMKVFSIQIHSNPLFLFNPIESSSTPFSLSFHRSTIGDKTRFILHDYFFLPLIFSLFSFSFAWNARIRVGPFIQKTTTSKKMRHEDAGTRSFVRLIRSFEILQID